MSRTVFLSMFQKIQAGEIFKSKYFRPCHDRFEKKKYIRFITMRTQRFSNLIKVLTYEQDGIPKHFSKNPGWRKARRLSRRAGRSQCTAENLHAARKTAGSSPSRKSLHLILASWGAATVLRQPVFWLLCIYFHIFATICIIAGISCINIDNQCAVFHFSLPWLLSDWQKRSPSCAFYLPWCKSRSPIVCITICWLFVICDSFLPVQELEEQCIVTENMEPLEHSKCLLYVDQYTAVSKGLNWVS